jgi:histidinol phosphatase-like enzyme
MNQQPKLLILDLDGTVRAAIDNRPPNTLEEIEVLPGVAAKLAQLRQQETKIVFASNQMGVGVRYAAEQWLANADPDSDFARWCRSKLNRPTADEAWHIAWATMERAGGADGGYLCFHYPAKSGQSPRPVPPDAGPEWSAQWRKPQSGMLLQALADFKAAPAEALMIGDMDSDRQAAEAAGVPFAWAADFFGFGQ